MRLPLLLAASLFALPAIAAAQQEMPGLDLSAEPKTPEAPPPPAKSSPLPDRDAEAPATMTAATAPKPGGLTEAQIVSEDRVKSVQRKAVLKRGRFELTPMAFVTINDAYYPRAGPGARVAYHLADSLALGLRYQQYNRLFDENVRIAQRQLQSQLTFALPQQSFGVDLLWSPLYGKVALFNSIHHFDLYVLGGAGVLLSDTSSAGVASPAGDGAHVTTSLGLGERFGLSDWFSIDLSLLETLYTDRPHVQGGVSLDKSVLQHALTLNVGFSFFLPVSFEYKEP